MARASAVVPALVVLVVCGPKQAPATPVSAPQGMTMLAPSHGHPAATCEDRTKPRVHLYDVSRELAAFIDLSDGRHILLDTGDEAHRTGCDSGAALGDRARRRHRFGNGRERNTYRQRTRVVGAWAVQVESSGPDTTAMSLTDQEG